MLAKIFVFAAVLVLGLSLTVEAASINVVRLFLWGPENELSRVQNQIITPVDENRNCKYSALNSDFNLSLVGNELLLAAFYEDSAAGSCTESGIKSDIKTILEMNGSEVQSNFITYERFDYDPENAENPCPNCPRGASAKCTEDKDCLTLTCDNEVCSDVFNPKFFNSAVSTALSMLLVVGMILLTIV